MAITITNSFTIPAVGASTSSLLVSDATQTPLHAEVLVSDGVNCAAMAVESSADSTHFVLETVQMLAGATGNTMGAGALVTLMTLPLSALPTIPFPALTDLLYTVQAGASYEAPWSAYISEFAPVASLHAAQQNISSLIHQWRCNDAAGSTSLADSVGSSNIALSGSSFQPGVPGLMNDGASCVFFSGASGIGAVSGVIPTSGAWCVEALCSIPAILNATSYGYFAAQGSAGDGHGVGVFQNCNPGSSTYGLCISNYSSNAQSSQTPGAHPVLLHMETDGTNMYLAINGTIMASAATYVTPSGKLYIGALSNNYFAGALFIQNIALYSAKLTQAQKWANMNAVYRR